MMKATRWQTLVVLAVSVGLAGHLLLRVLGDTPPLPVSRLMWLLFVVLAAGILALGWAVRRFVQGQRTPVDALKAARVVLLAKACAYAGACLTGYFAAQASLVLVNPGAPALRSHAVSSVLAAVASVVFVVAAGVAEWWCRVPPDDDEDGPASRA